MIRTKLHILAENIDPDTMTTGAENETVQRMLAAASYVVDKEVLNLLSREDASKSVKALIDANLVHLPYNPMVVEYEVTPLHHEFVLLREENGCIYGTVTVMDNKIHAAMVANREVKLELVDGAFIMTGYPKADSREAKVITSAFMTGVSIALLMLNTKGIEKEVIEVPARFNKKRQARNKPPIPKHSIVHIGTIYRRDGTAIKRDGRGGWHMPMHWRCGYTRRQHFGVGREDERMVFIPPCIVNFKPEENAPTAPKRKIKV